ncbi:glycosyltransferase [Rhodococcoides corynebacterioides]|uniref:glycosyltransferase n=1 Tax=Rhodococcoides corynebacterioides TaxID=53972 RepID=UPI001C9B857E|nr:glycosyltransferase [Rhodococcus corynebacterioides]MBY6361526.1 glycosyltransferase [Rhodococcus corynebacterioides]
MTNPSVSIIGTRGYPSYYGGFETLVRHLAPYLAEHGWDVTVYGRGRTADNGENEGDPRVRSIDSIGFESKSLSTLSYGLSSTVHCAYAKPDVALVMNVANGFWLPLLRARGIPSLVNVDGIEWERAKWGKTAKKLFRAGATATARHADNLVFDSKALGARWNREFSRAGEFIPYGGSPAKNRPVVEGLERRGYVLMVARFVPENTVAEFLDAAEQLSKHWHVVVVGSSGYGGPLEERLKQITEQNRRVKWFGHVSDDEILFSLWENCGAYFHGHSVGGTNPALVQAMALGAPTVARDTVFNREVLADSAIFVQPESNSIVAGVTTMMTEDGARIRYSTQASHRAEALYTWDYVCGGYERALLGLLGR